VLTPLPPSAWVYMEEGGNPKKIMVSARTDKIKIAVRRHDMGQGFNMVPRDDKSVHHSGVTKVLSVERRDGHFSENTKNGFPKIAADH